MDKYPLIGVSIFAVVLLVLGSLTNVVGYQTVQSSNQEVIKDDVDQKELLLQTILDIANDGEIQKLLLNSEMRRGEFFESGMSFSVSTFHILTKKELNTAYHIGLILSKTLGISKIHSMFERYRVSNQGVQKELTAVIEKDAKLNAEMTQLSDLKCNCENDNTTRWSYPVLCTILFPLFYLSLLIGVVFQKEFYFIVIIHELVLLLNCSWYPF